MISLFKITTKEILEDKVYLEKKYNLIFKYLLNTKIFGDAYYQADCIFYKVFLDKKFVALICLNAGKNLLENHIHLAIIEVDKRLRHKGIGSKIIQYLKIYAINNEYSGITLIPKNDKVKDFYYKLGFEDYKKFGSFKFLTFSF